MARLNVGVGTSTADATDVAVREAIDAARRGLGGALPGLAVLTSTVDHDAAEVLALVHAALGAEVPVHGVTTSLGVLSGEGVAVGAHGAMDVMLLGGDGARFRASSAELGDDGAAAGRAAASALGAEGKPALVLFAASPGVEEDILRGVREVLGDVPIFGGSAADHAIAGQWSVFANDRALTSAVSLAAFYGDVAVSGNFSAPYVPAGPTAAVTGAEGRTLLTLEGRPASQILGEWVGESIASQVEGGGNILAQSALRPLGIRHSSRDGDYYVTVHPANIRSADGAVDVFARVSPGTTLCAMEGSTEGLVDALDGLIEGAQKGLSEARGGILIYCAGCAGSVGERLDAGLREKWKRAMGDVPLIGMCTFGEQGTVPGVGAVHANLSLGLVLLGDR